MDSLAIKKYLKQQYQNEKDYKKAQLIKQRKNAPQPIRFPPRRFEQSDFAICEQKALLNNDWEAAKALNLHLWEVQQILNTPEGKEAMNKYSEKFAETLRDRIDSFAPIAEQFLDRIGICIC
jgi:hypothetical protein